MKRILILTAFVCLVSMLLPTCAPAPEPEPEAEPVFDQAAEEAAIREAAEQAYETLSKGDIKAHLALYTVPYETFFGSIDLAAHEKMDSANPNLRRKILSEINLSFVTPDVAICTTREEVTGSLDADGKPLPPSKMLIARVFVKKNGKWLCAAYLGTPIEE